jgi:hypothetical protein
MAGGNIGIVGIGIKINCKGFAHFRLKQSVLTALGALSILAGHDNVGSMIIFYHDTCGTDDNQYPVGAVQLKSRISFTVKKVLC